MTDINKLSITSCVDKDRIYIDLPIELLVWACEQREDSLAAHRVINKEIFANEVARRIVHEVRPEEDGSSAFTRLLDTLFEEIYADGVECFDDEFEEKKALIQSGIEADNLKDQESKNHNS